MKPASNDPRPRLSGADPLDEPLTAEEREALSSVVLCRSRSENRLDRRTVKAIAQAALAARRYIDANRKPGSPS